MAAMVESRRLHEGKYTKYTMTCFRGNEEKLSSVLSFANHESPSITVQLSLTSLEKCSQLLSFLD